MDANFKQDDLSQTKLSIATLNSAQQEILRLMTLKGPARFRDLRPDDLEGNLYSYHLKELQAAGYVKKTNRGYELDSKGKWYVGVSSSDTGEIRLQPKIVVMLFVTNQNGEYLLYRWHRQPFRNTISLPYGKSHFGSSMMSMAKRELTMKTSLDCQLKIKGNAYVRVVENNFTFSHMLAHVFVGEAEGEPKSTVPLGECFWGKFEDYPEHDWAPGLPEIIDALKTNQPFFLDLVVEL